MVGVIHEDCAGFGDGLGFQALNEEDSAKAEVTKSDIKPLNEEKKEEEK